MVAVIGPLSRLLFCIVEDRTRRARESVAVHFDHEGNLAPTSKLTRRSISGDLDELPFIASPFFTQTPKPLLSLELGSPASGFDCCIVPSAWKTNIWKGKGASGAFTIHVPTIGDKLLLPL